MFLECMVKAPIARPLHFESSNSSKYMRLIGDAEFGVYVAGGLETDTLRLTGLPSLDPQMLGAIYAESDGILRISNG